MGAFSSKWKPFVRFEPVDHLSNATVDGTVLEARAVLEKVRIVDEDTLEMPMGGETLDGLDSFLYRCDCLGFESCTGREFLSLGWR